MILPVISNSFLSLSSSDSSFVRKTDDSCHGSRLSQAASPYRVGEFCQGYPRSLRCSMDSRAQLQSSLSVLVFGLPSGRRPSIISGNDEPLQGNQARVPCREPRVIQVFGGNTDKLERELERMARQKFEFVVSMQRYSKLTKEEQENAEFLLRAYPAGSSDCLPRRTS